MKNMKKSQPHTTENAYHNLELKLRLLVRKMESINHKVHKVGTKYTK